MKKFLQTIFLTFGVLTPLSAVTVTVTCSNGQKVPKLTVKTYDSALQEVPNTSPTNSLGQFELNTDPSDVPPYSMFFEAVTGSSCGGVPININGSEGHVLLNYYPVDAPCSCSKLVP